MGTNYPIHGALDGGEGTLVVFTNWRTHSSMSPIVLTLTSWDDYQDIGWGEVMRFALHRQNAPGVEVGVTSQWVTGEEGLAQPLLYNPRDGVGDTNFPPGEYGLMGRTGKVFQPIDGKGTDVGFQGILNI